MSKMAQNNRKALFLGVLIFYMRRKSMVRYNNININITSSDATDVRVNNADAESLQLLFKDYMKKQVVVTFKDIVAYRFQKLQETTGGKNDQIFEVIESEWLKQELPDKSEGEREKYAHFMFCFNKMDKAFHIICNKKFDFTKND